MAMFHEIDEKDPIRATLHSALEYFATTYDVYISVLSDYLMLDDDYVIMAQLDGSACLLVLRVGTRYGSKYFEVVKGVNAYNLYWYYANYKDLFFNKPFELPEEDETV